MSDQEPIVPATPEGSENKPAPAPLPTPAVTEPRGWMEKAGEWLQRPPGRRMGLITTLIVLAIMFLLVLLAGKR